MAVGLIDPERKSYLDSWEPVAESGVCKMGLMERYRDHRCDVAK